MKTKVLAAVCAAALALSGCAQMQTSLVRLNNFADKYGPLIGKDLIMVGNIIIQAECSPALAVGTQVVQSVMNIVVPDPGAIAVVTGILQANIQATQKLCPLIASIKATVGKVPQNAIPTQVVEPAAPV